MYTKFIISRPVGRYEMIGVRRPSVRSSVRPSHFHSNISHLQNALQQITSWMTANLLTLNSSKTEFLLIGLKQQLCKNTGLLCSQPWFYFLMNTLPSLIKSLHIRELRCIRPYLDLPPL